MISRIFRAFAWSCLLGLFFLALPSWAAEAMSAKLALLETTDLHAHVLGYDYLKLTPDNSLGLDRLSTLIRQARAEFGNTLLFDAGDTIEGSALGDYQAGIQAPPCGEAIAIFKAMNALGYDVATVGNHEFNYGLDWLARASGRVLPVNDHGKAQTRCVGPNFPLVLANVTAKNSGKLLFPPWVILQRQIRGQTASGEVVSRTLRVGVIGFTPPQILTWDKRWLKDKVTTTDTLKVAQKYIAAMRQNGADLVVAIIHGGIDANPDRTPFEHPAWHLAKAKLGIDAFMLGHSHQVFPDANSTVAGFNAAGVDKARGLIHDTPAVMAGFWGKHLGVIALQLEHDGERWQVKREVTQVQVRSVKSGSGESVVADPAIAQLIDPEHQAAINWVRTPIGETDYPINSYFADLGEVSAIQPVNMAQAAFVEEHIRLNQPAWAQHNKQPVPVISVSAPFKSGFGGLSDYTSIPVGPLAIFNAADLYIYPNTLYAVKLNGKLLKAWLEAAARRFNRIDPQKTTAQTLIGNSPGYNFDMPTDARLQYEIDVSAPLGSRIQGLTWQGKAIEDDAQFIVATNNYRASNLEGFLNQSGGEIVFTSVEANRDIVIHYLREIKKLTLLQHGSAQSWRFKPLPLQGQVVFNAPGQHAEFANKRGIFVEEMTPASP